MNELKNKELQYIIGEVYHIRFGKTLLPEINDVHLGIIFPIKNCKTMAFCLPLTSVKEKHFKNKKSFIKRNYHELKYPHTYYISETDSIALLEQIRAISISRIESVYKVDSAPVKISDNCLNKIIKHTNLFVLKDIIDYK